MLFDLRSRGRRRTVQVVYIGLAILIGLGLVGFGVGTGTGGGGIFGALSSNGSGGNSNSAVTKQVNAAVKRTQRQPGSAAAWSNLVNARFAAANSAGFDSQSSTYTAAGKRQLALVAQAYGHYTKLTKTPSSDTTTLAARAYGQLGQYKQAATAWQTVVSGNSSNLKGLECVALNSFAAKNTRVAQLAETQVLAKIPKAQRKTIKTQIESARTQPAVVAQSC